MRAPDNLSQDRLSRFGLVNADSLRKIASTRQPFLIEDFMLKPSINIIAGDSGLGKSALCAQLAMCVCANRPFFGHQIEDPGPVIYCDAESTPAMMSPMVDALAKHVGLNGTPPEFLLWNPTWNVANKDVVIAQNKVQLYQMVKALKPRLVVLDSLRNFYPMAIKEGEITAGMIREMRKYSGETDCSWLIIHHLRKKNKEEMANNLRPTVRHDIHLWLEEASGQLALINNTDLRLGWEKEQKVGGQDFWFAGFLRVFGQVGPYKVVRELDNEGEPQGYRLASPFEQLNQAEQEIYSELPDKREFTFKYLTNKLGKSRGISARFVRRCSDLRIIEVVRSIASNNGGRPQRVYRKREVSDF